MGSVCVCVCVSRNTGVERKETKHIRHAFTMKILYLFRVHNFAFINLKVAHGNRWIEGRAERFGQLVLGKILLGNLTLALLMLPLDLVK